MGKALIVSILILMCSSTFAKDFVYEVNGNKYEGFIINKGKKAPTVFIIHDWDGLTDYEKKRSNMLAEKGYSVFAIDLFGKGVRPTELKDKKEHTGELFKDRKKMRDLLAGALKAAKAQGLNTDRKVAMGYCFGGSAVLEWARAGTPFNGFVTFHGGLGTPEGQNYKKTKGSVLVFHGSADSMISMQDFASLTEQLEKEKITNEMIAYGGAPHAFTVYGQDSYRKEADQQSWTRFISYLKEHLN